MPSPAKPRSPSQSRPKQAPKPMRGPTVGHTKRELSTSKFDVERRAHSASLRDQGRLLPGKSVPEDYKSFGDPKRAPTKRTMVRKA